MTHTYPPKVVNPDTLDYRALYLEERAARVELERRVRELEADVASWKHLSQKPVAE